MFPMHASRPMTYLRTVDRGDSLLVQKVDLIHDEKEKFIIAYSEQRRSSCPVPSGQFPIDRGNFGHKEFSTKEEAYIAFYQKVADFVES